MQDAVLNLCRVKLRDQQRLERVGYLEEYPQYPNGEFGEAVPRGGNAGGGGQPGWVLKCKGWETDPNAYIYFTVQEQNWARTAEAIGRPEWAEDPEYNTALARQPHIFDIFGEIEKWLADKTKYEAVDILRKWEVPCAPVISMKELAEDPDTAQERHDRRGRAEGPRHLPDRRQPDQVLRRSSPRSRAHRCSASTPTRCLPTSATTRTPSPHGTRRRSSPEPARPGENRPRSPPGAVPPFLLAVHLRAGRRRAP